MTIEQIINKINNLPLDCIQIVESIQTNSIAVTDLDNLSNLIELIVISGFSEGSFERNKKVLFANNSRNFPLDKFKKIHLVKFTDDIVYNLHQEIFKSSYASDSEILENILYKKCGEILFDKLHKNSVYSVLAKSTGAGPAIFMCDSHPEILSGLNLFAPGVRFIHKAIDKVSDSFPRTIVGWNSDDTKVKLVDVWFNLNKILPDETILFSYYSDQNKSFDTQHEINSEFFDKII